MASTDAPKNNGGISKLSCNGNPVNTITGNKYQVETDLNSSGLSSLSLQRTYNSNDSIFNTNFGAQWRSNFDRSITLESNNGYSIATVFQPDGKIYYFTYNQDLWSSDSDISDNLIQLEDGAGNVIGWKYVTSNDFQEIYNANGKLSSILDRNNNT